MASTGCRVSARPTGSEDVSARTGLRLWSGARAGLRYLSPPEPRTTDRRNDQQAHPRVCHRGILPDNIPDGWRESGPFSSGGTRVFVAAQAGASRALRPLRMDRAPGFFNISSPPAKRHRTSPPCSALARLPAPAFRTLVPVLFRQAASSIGSFDLFPISPPVRGALSAVLKQVLGDLSRGDGHLNRDSSLELCQRKWRLEALLPQLEPSPRSR